MSPEKSSTGTPIPTGGRSWSGTGLLEQIADTALDDDYYVYRGSEPRRSSSAGFVLAIVVALLAIGLTTAAVQTRNDRPATELERRTLAADIQARQKTLDERRVVAAELSAEVQALRAAQEDVESQEGVDVLAAFEAARGPGVVVTVSDRRPGVDATDEGRVTDHDLQILVNGLWYAGAEAIAIDDHRISALSAIRTAADAVTVNYVSVSPPYTVEALGDPDALLTRFAQNPAGAYWEKRRERAGVKFDMTPSTDIAVPAAPAERLELKHAKRLEEGR
jgi:uncharacterized protein YlxW (UPF0749 family)